MWWRPLNHHICFDTYFDVKAIGFNDMLKSASLYLRAVNFETYFECIFLWYYHILPFMVKEKFRFMLTTAMKS